MSNVHGLFSNKKKEDDDKKKKEDDDSNNRYVGGIGEHGGGSGLAVQPNPDLDGGNSSSGTRDAIFGRAEDGGNNDGGDEDSSSSAVRRVITMYRDGFMVDDGPYRRLDDPSNAEFLRALAMGRTPRELSDANEDVVVGLVDKRNEEYVEPFQSFSGTGLSLGATNTSSSSSSNVFDPNVLLSSSSTTTHNNTIHAEPTTSIAVRLLNGSRKVIKISLSATVQDLATLLVVEDATIAPFRFVSGYPPKPIEDIHATILDAGLKGAQVSMQKA